MSPRRSPALLLALMAALALPAAASTQEIRGVALDADGRPLPGVVVALHRVGGGAGASVASTTTDDQGLFRFSVQVPDSAVYFAAMRYDQRMYIGPAVRAGVERVEDYRLQADPAAEAGAVASALSDDRTGPAMGVRMEPPRTAPTPGSRGTGGGAALWVVALLGLAAAAAFLGAAPRYRRKRTRDALIELATVENRLTEGPDGPERDTLTRRRDQLRERLAPRA